MSDLNLQWLADNFSNQQTIIFDIGCANMNGDTARIRQMLPDPFRCVQMVPHEIVHRAAFELDEPKRRYEIWQDEFEQAYNVKFGTLKVVDKYCLIFDSEEDYTMFMLRWA